MIQLIARSQLEELIDKYKEQEMRSCYLSLLDPTCILTNFKNIPRSFEVSTNDGSCFFNTLLIKSVSSTIFDYLEKNPESKNYHLSIDNNKVLKKIEETLQGNNITINKTEFYQLQKISQMLHIEPIEKYHFNDSQNDYTLSIYFTSQEFFLYNKLAEITISTRQDNYRCNLYGVCSSKIIRDFIMANPGSDYYIYEYDDKHHEFSKICEFFNFGNIPKKDLNFVKKIAEDLQIDLILDKTNQIHEKIVEKIDEKLELVDIINELFEWLYKINELSVITVKNSIIESEWSKTEENVQELASFILQVISTDSRLHQSLIDLLIQLDLENSKELKILFPFLKEKIMNKFSNDNNLCSFVYKLYNKGFVSKDQLFERLKNKCCNSKENFSNLYNWFLPELIEIDCFDQNKVTNNKSLNMFLPDKIDLYKKMRDSGEPIDEIAKALKNDDVDTLQKCMIQSLVSNKNQNFSRFTIIKTIFESCKNKYLSYINYAANYGSIKCFKYLMLNHSEIDQETFNSAIHGGNIEIIKIVDNYLQHNNNFKDDDYRFKNDITDILIYLIQNHKNNLFDWIFEQKIKNIELISFCFPDIIDCCVSNCNIHALISLIDKGYEIFDKGVLSVAATHGFYRLLKFLYNIVNEYTDSFSCWGNQSINYISFGNLSIFKFYIKTNPNQLNTALQTAIECNQTKMINYFFDEKSDKITNKTISLVLSKSLTKSDELFYSFIDRFKKTAPLVFDKYNWDIQLLETSCKYGRGNIFYYIINLIKNPKNKIDFSRCLFEAASFGLIEICNYIIENKFNINYHNLFTNIANCSKISNEFLVLLINNCDIKFDKSTFLPLLGPAIKNHNANFVEFLLSKGFFYEECLIDSVLTCDIIIAQSILKYKSNPSFINKGSSEGTALHIAVKKNDLNMVKLLLSIPSINPYLFDKYNQTPLMIASKQLSYDIIYELISSCDKNIISFKSTIECLLDSLIKGINTFSSNVTEKINKTYEILKVLLNIENIEYFFINRNLKHFADFINKKQISFIQLFLKLESIDINSILPSGDTLFITAIKTNCQEIIDLFMNDPRVDINRPNLNGESPLYNSLKMNNFELAKRILSVPSNPYIIEFAINYLINSLGRSSKQNQSIYNIFNTILNLPNIETLIFSELKDQYFLKICSRQDIDINIVQQFLKIKNIDVNICSSLTGDNLLISSLKTKRVDIAELLINDPRIDVNITNFNHESALIIATQNELISIVKLLINHKKFDPEASHADVAALLSKNDIFDILYSLDSIDINGAPIDFYLNKNYYNWGKKNNYSYSYPNDGETPLIAATNNQDLMKINRIISHLKFDKNKSNLLMAMKILNKGSNKSLISEFIKVLIQNGLLDFCFQQINLFSDLLGKSDIEKLNELINNSNNLVISDEEIMSLFNFSLNINNNSLNILQFLLNYDKKHNNVIDFEKNSYLTKLKTISIYSQNVCNIVNFIIENGGNVNKADENGVYPFQYAISTNSLELVEALIKTNKVNYNQLISKTHIKIHNWGYTNNNSSTNNNDDSNNNNNINNNSINTNNNGNSNNKEDSNNNNDESDNKSKNSYKVCTETYLHLAAAGDKNVFKLLLETNIFDINAKNSNNKTPLMIACQNIETENINLLFQKDDLDFHCRNDKNEDALDITKKIVNICKEKESDNENESHAYLEKNQITTSIDEKISNDSLSKEQYLEKLLSYISSLNLEKRFSWKSRDESSWGGSGSSWINNGSSWETADMAEENVMNDFVETILASKRVLSTRI